MTQCTELIACLEPFVQGLGKAILREAADAIEALCVQSNKRGTLAIANGIRMEHAEAERDALQAEVERLQREVVSRNQRALDGDLAVKVRDAELLINDTLRAQLAAAQARERHTRKTLHKFMQVAQQAQPERAPLSTDTIADIARRMEATNCEDSLWVEFTRAIEAAIKQGGQHD